MMKKKAEKHLIAFIRKEKKSHFVDNVLKQQQRHRGAHISEVFLLS